ncbi:hypothetical protein ACHAWF_012176 [Thalassiosira exigua]
MPMSRLFSQALAAATISLSAWTMRTPTLEVHAFAAPRVVRASMTPRTPPSRRFAEASSPASPDSEVLSSPQDMRLREIQSELKERKVSYSDCFDRESLVKRLTEAREGSILPSVDESSGPAEATSSEAEHETTDTSPAEATTTKPAVEGGKGEEFDRESTLAELRSLRVKELKVKLSELKVRWGTMIEKEEMVQALCGAMEERFEQSKNFSRSGELTPGTVRDVDESVLTKELGWSESDINRGVATAAVEADTSGGDPNPPILLDGKIFLSSRLFFGATLIDLATHVTSVCHMVWTLSVPCTAACRGSRGVGAHGKGSQD